MSDTDALAANTPEADVDVPCPEDHTKTCRIVDWGTQITTADGGVRDINEVVEVVFHSPTVSPMKQVAMKRAINQAMESQGPAMQELKGLQPNYNLGVLTQKSSSGPSVLNAQQPGQTGIPPSNAENSPSSSPQIASFTSTPSIGTRSSSWQEASCQVRDSVVTVSDESEGMVDVLCNSAGEKASVRGTPNPPTLNCPNSSAPAVAIRNTDGPWHTTSCGSSHVSVRSTTSGQWADVTCPAANQVVAVRMGTGRWAETQCPQEGKFITMRASQAAQKNALYAQFAGSSLGSTGKTLPFGNDKIASINSNLFSLVNNQYQNQRDRGEFIEGDNKPPFVIPYIPSESSGSQ